MVTIEELSTHLFRQFKQVRLTALKDAPTAFGSTYAREADRTDEDWIKLASVWNSDRSVFYIAIDHARPCGMIGARLDETASSLAWVLSMWVAPSHRRTGLGVKLMGEVERWARRAGVNGLRLMVTSNNTAAQAFYQRCGFQQTGRTQPYDNDPALLEFEMARDIEWR